MEPTPRKPEAPLSPLDQVKLEESMRFRTVEALRLARSSETSSVSFKKNFAADVFWPTMQVKNLRALCLGEMSPMLMPPPARALKSPAMLPPPELLMTFRSEPSVLALSPPGFLNPSFESSRWSESELWVAHSPSVVLQVEALSFLSSTSHGSKSLLTASNMSSSLRSSPMESTKSTSPKRVLTLSSTLATATPLLIPRNFTST
mmetsp:Transcript_11197/g.25106  ORF Transcript_11197/g.25106 Transcript_11197/m.25106 type:complete len:204 (+) Transcript_11197:234-845(+)